MISFISICARKKNHFLIEQYLSDHGNSCLHAKIIFDIDGFIIFISISVQMDIFGDATQQSL